MRWLTRMRGGKTKSKQWIAGFPAAPHVSNESLRWFRWQQSITLKLDWRKGPAQRSDTSTLTEATNPSFLAWATATLSKSFRGYLNHALTA